MLAPGGQRPETLQSLLQYTGRAPATKDFAATNIDSAEAEGATSTRSKPSKH